MVGKRLTPGGIVSFRFVKWSGSTRIFKPLAKHGAGKPASGISVRTESEVLGNKQSLDEEISNGPSRLVKHAGNLDSPDIPRVPLEQRDIPISPELRMRVLSRDGYYCRTPGCWNVARPNHHIMPWAKGGLTTEDGLLGLCDQCHSVLIHLLKILLPRPLHSRFSMKERLDFYSTGDLEEVARKEGERLNAKVSRKAARILAGDSRGTPRNVLSNLGRARNLAQIESGRPTGLRTLADQLGEDRKTIAEIHEPYLLRKGLISRSYRGRMATEKARRNFSSLTAP